MMREPDAKPMCSFYYTMVCQSVFDLVFQIPQPKKII